MVSGKGSATELAEGPGEGRRENEEETGREKKRGGRDRIEEEREGDTERGDRNGEETQGQIRGNDIVRRRKRGTEGDEG